MVILIVINRLWRRITQRGFRAIHDAGSSNIGKVVVKSVSVSQNLHSLVLETIDFVV